MHIELCRDKVKQIDKIALSSKNIKQNFYVSRNSKFSVKDYLREQNENCIQNCLKIKIQII